MYKQVLVTLDGSPLSEAVLPHVLELAAGSGIRVTLMAVADQPEPIGTVRVEKRGLIDAAGNLEEVTLQETQAIREGETREQALQRVQDELQVYLEKQAKPFWDQGIETKCIVKIGEPVQEIVDYARRQDVDLVAMATHGRTGLARLVFGSVTTRVLATVAKPVLVVRPSQIDE